jgi:hypothetical protein
MSMKKLTAAFAIAFAAILTLSASLGGSLGPWPQTGNLNVQQQSGGVQGSGTFTVSTSGSDYLSSGGSAATSVPCNWIAISVSTTTAKLSTTGTGALTIPAGLAPFTISASNLNTIQVSGSNAIIGYLYGN